MNIPKTNILNALVLNAALVKAPAVPQVAADDERLAVPGIAVASEEESARAQLIFQQNLGRLASNDLGELALASRAYLRLKSEIPHARSTIVFGRRLGNVIVEKLNYQIDRTLDAETVDTSLLAVAYALGKPFLEDGASAELFHLLENTLQSGDQDKNLQFARYGRAMRLLHMTLPITIRPQRFYQYLEALRDQPTAAGFLERIGDVESAVDRELGNLDSQVTDGSKDNLEIARVWVSRMDLALVFPEVLPYQFAAERASYNLQLTLLAAMEIAPEDSRGATEIALENVAFGLRTGEVWDFPSLVEIILTHGKEEDIQALQVLFKKAGDQIDAGESPTDVPEGVLWVPFAMAYVEYLIQVKRGGDLDPALRSVIQEKNHLVELLGQKVIFPEQFIGEMGYIIHHVAVTCQNWGFPEIKDDVLAGWEATLDQGRAALRQAAEDLNYPPELDELLFELERVAQEIQVGIDPEPRIQTLMNETLPNLGVALAAGRLPLLEATVSTALGQWAMLATSPAVSTNPDLLMGMRQSLAAVLDQMEERAKVLTTPVENGIAMAQISLLRFFNSDSGESAREYLQKAQSFYQQSRDSFEAHPFENEEVRAYFHRVLVGIGQQIDQYQLSFAPVEQPKNILEKIDG